MEKAAKPGRILALDYLRGYFVMVIVIDHIFRFPNIFAGITGEARLWMTAAEGFVMISGLLIGYVRGRKALTQPFKQVAKKLASRALLLYVWMIIVSVIYVAVDWHTFIPGIPSPTTPEGDWKQVVVSIITLQHPHTWIHFLSLYTIFLLLSIGAIWLLRKQKWWLLGSLSIAVYLVGWTTHTEWMIWQILFFGAAIAGYHLDSIRTTWSTFATEKKQKGLAVLFCATILTFIISVVSVFFPSLLPSPITSWLHEAFSIDTFAPYRLVIVALWFTAFCLVFEKIYPFLAKYTFGIFKTFGSMSLTAYIIHGGVICLLNAFVPFSESILINSIVTFGGVLLVYGLISLKPVQKIIPR